MRCIACRAGEPILTSSEIDELRTQAPEWQVKQVDGIKRLERIFKLTNILEAFDFTIKISQVAEVEGHHPLIITEWGKATLQWWTHKIGDLHRNDFIIAAKTDLLFIETQ